MSNNTTNNEKRMSCPKLKLRKILAPEGKEYKFSICTIEEWRSVDGKSWTETMNIAKKKLFL